MTIHFGWAVATVHVDVHAYAGADSTTDHEAREKSVATGALAALGMGAAAARRAPPGAADADEPARAGQIAVSHLVTQA